MKTKIGETLPKMTALPGTVLPQWVRCGKCNCRCTRGELHGPYYAHYWRENGKLKKRYVKREHGQTIKALCDARREQKRDVQAAMGSWREMCSVVRELEQQ